MPCDCEDELLALQSLLSNVSGSLQGQIDTNTLDIVSISGGLLEHDAEIDTLFSNTVGISGGLQQITDNFAIEMRIVTIETKLFDYRGVEQIDYKTNIQYRVPNGEWTSAPEIFEFEDRRGIGP
jgi:hypothetical protein